jgi:hypothetical protein
MEAIVRTRYHGVWNIIRFNWHFYLFAFVVIILLLIVSIFLNRVLWWLCVASIAVIVMSTLISLVVSHIVYDRSGLYSFNWMKNIRQRQPAVIANIHAGFDETSAILKNYFPAARLMVYDFYHSDKHTEVSIERARRAYPAFPGTIKISSDKLTLEKQSVDIVFNIFALHEIRNQVERIGFLKQQALALREDGHCIVVEHLRDVPNFLAYNIGFFHFFPARVWQTTFSEAGLSVRNRFNVTPFISVFILNKVNGDTR